MPVEDISVVTSGVWTPNLGHSQFIACFRDANGLHQAVAGNSEDSSEINWLGKYGSLQYRAASLVGNYDMIAVGDDGGHAVVSRTKNGGLDKSFGDNGFVHLVWKGEKVEANTVVILTDGRMVVGGGVYEDGEPRGFMACLFGNGTKDTDFGAGGWLIFDNVSQVGVVHTIEVMPDGRMIALGEAAVNGWTTPYTALIDPAGRFDQSYGSMGVAIVPPEAGWRVTGNTMALTEDGKLIVGATAVDLLSNQVVGNSTLERLKWETRSLESLLS